LEAIEGELALIPTQRMNVVTTIELPSSIFDVERINSRGGVLEDLRSRGELVARTGVGDRGEKENGGSNKRERGKHCLCWCNEAL